MTSTQPSRPPAEHTLLSTADPTVWAEEFVRIFDGLMITLRENEAGVHTDVMAGWFAKAMATALTLHNQEVEEVESPLLMDILAEDDDEDDTQPTLEEKFREGFEEGR